jgi:hypothetical protein
MKRFFFISLALILVAGFVTTAAAEDRLSLSGEYRVRGFYTENTFGYDSDDKSDNLSYFDQRFRLGGKITASEGVTANFRMDFGESKWGQRDGNGNVPGNGRYENGTFGEFHIDRLYLRIERDIANFVAGQYDGAYGYVSAYETQAKWLLLRLKPGPLFIDLNYIKADEGAGNSDEKDLGTEDADLFGANVMYNAENFAAGAWLGYGMDKTSDAAAPATTETFDSDLTGVGLYGSGSFGIVDIKAEFDFFSGEEKDTLAPAGTPTEDLKGQQFWGYANIKLGDTMAIPVHLLYAKGYANKENESQVVEMAPAFGDFYPYNLSSIWNGDYSPWGSGEAFDVADTGGGIMGLFAGFDMAVAEEHKIEFQAGYAMPEDEVKAGVGVAPEDTMSSFMFGAAGWSWDFVPAAQFAAAFVYGVPSFDDGTAKDDAAYQLLTKIRVKF